MLYYPIPIRAQETSQSQSSSSHVLAIKETTWQGRKGISEITAGLQRKILGRGQSEKGWGEGGS